MMLTRTIIIAFILCGQNVLTWASNPDDDNDPPPSQHKAPKKVTIKEPLNKAPTQDDSSVERAEDDSSLERGMEEFEDLGATPKSISLIDFLAPPSKVFKTSVNNKPFVHRFKMGPRMDSLTPTSVRVWGMAAQMVNDTHKVMGVLRYKERGSGRDYSHPIYFPLLEQNDYAGMCELTGLKSGQTYKFQMGYVFLPKESNEKPTELHWGYRSSGKKQPKGVIPNKGSSMRGQFETVSLEPQTIRFVFSSCNYQNPQDPTDALKDAGYRGVVARRGAESISLLPKFLEQNGIRRLDGIVHLGDFVYVDYMNVIDGAHSWKEIFALYKDILTKPELHHLLKQTPLTTALDDHELENNFNAEVFENPSERAKNAMRAVKLFHSMVTPTYTPQGNQFGTFWRETTIGDIPLFMMDMRTERYPSKKQLISPEQLNKLKEFLLKNKDKSVQFIGSSVPLAPDFDPKEDLESYNDTWSGYPETRTDLLNFMKENKIYNVVCLSGDVHFSSHSQITAADDKSFKILSLISSPWFWPVYFEHARHMTQHSIGDEKNPHAFQAKLLSKQFDTNNFTYVEIDAARTQMKVQIVAEKHRNILQRLWQRFKGTYVPTPDTLFGKIYELHSQQIDSQGTASK